MVKKKRFFKLIIFLTLSLPAISYADEWGDSDITKEVTWQILHIMDWKQTIMISKQPDKYYEMNPILGRHPSKGKVNTYMSVCAIMHLGISHILPQKHREYWQYITIGMSGTTVLHNFSIGLKVSF